MRNNSNGRIKPAVIALFLAIIALLNVGFIALLRHNSSSSESKHNSTEDYYVITSESADSESKDSSDTDAASTEGPVITYRKSKAPTLSQDDLDNIAYLYEKAGALSAVDSEGYDITDEIDAYYSPDTSEKLRFYLLLSVTDENGNKDKIDTSFKIELTGPILMTTKTKVHVDKNSTFNYSDYILYVLDKNGDEVDTDISYLGKVDTSNPGTYVVTYYATVDGTKIERTLNVIVDDK